MTKLLTSNAQITPSISNCYHRTWNSLILSVSSYLSLIISVLHPYVLSVKAPIAARSTLIPYSWRLLKIICDATEILDGKINNTCTFTSESCLFQFLSLEGQPSLWFFKHYLFHAVSMECYLSQLHYQYINSIHLLVPLSLTKPSNLIILYGVWWLVLS